MTETTFVSLKESECRLFRDLIYQEAGISLNESKFQLVESRLAKRLRALKLDSYQSYYDYLMNEDGSGEEQLKMINCLTTNKTDFFREEHHFEYLKSDVFPAIERRARDTGKKKLRIWSAACSTGEEPYTLAMTVLDHFGPSAINDWDIRILASDVDTDVIAHAEKGIYAEDRAGGLSPEIIRRHFIKTSREPDSPVQVKPELRSLIAFRRINFVERAWPIHTTFDVIFCRNVMIYFDDSTQDRLLARFADHLNPQGHLFIGHSESILRLETVYRPLGKTIYQLGTGIDAATRSTQQSPVGASAGPSLPSVVKQQARPLNESSAIRGPVASTRIPGSDTILASRSQPKTSDAELANDQIFGSKLMPQLRAFPKHPIIVGEVKASAEPLRVSTLVGSCIAVCLYDPKVHVGGVNHFMLPASKNANSSSANFGVHAMELLINEIMRLGGDRRRLVAKVFGGGNVLRRDDDHNSKMAIGDRNARFAFEFLSTDNIPVVGEDVGGFTGRQIHFLTHTGQVFVRRIEREDHFHVLSEKQPRRPHNPPAMVESSLELFV